MRSSVGLDLIRSIYSSNGISAALALMGFDGSAFELSYKGTILLPTIFFEVLRCPFFACRPVTGQAFYNQGSAWI